MQVLRKERKEFINFITKKIFCLFCWPRYCFYKIEVANMINLFKRYLRNTILVEFLENRMVYSNSQAITCSLYQCPGCRTIVRIWISDELVGAGIKLATSNVLQSIRVLITSVRLSIVYSFFYRDLVLMAAEDCS